MKFGFQPYPVTAVYLETAKDLGAIVSANGQTVWMHPDDYPQGGEAELGSDPAAHAAIYAV